MQSCIYKECSNSENYHNAEYQNCSAEKLGSTIKEYSLL